MSTLDVVVYLAAFICLGLCLGLGWIAFRLTSGSWYSRVRIHTRPFAALSFLFVASLAGLLGSAIGLLSPFAGLGSYFVLAAGLGWLYARLDAFLAGSSERQSDAV